MLSSSVQVFPSPVPNGDHTVSLPVISMAGEDCTGAGYYDQRNSERHAHRQAIH
jgi:hypothetical protein